MKKLLALTIILLSLGSTAFAQKDKIEGLWYDEKKEAKIQIYKAVDGKFWGKIVWLKEPLKNGKPKVDENNDNKGQRNTPLMNLPILRSMEKTSDDKYENGKVYDPKKGSDYHCIITYRNANELGLRGYIGISLIGRTSTWTRAAQ